MGRKNIIMMILLAIFLLFVFGCDRGSETVTLTISTMGEGVVKWENIDNEWVEIAGEQELSKGALVELQPVPALGWVFEEWQGAEFAENNGVYSFEIDEDVKITAVFAEASTVKYTLIMEKTEGEGTVVPEVGKHEYEEGRVVELLATPAPDWYFLEWIGDVADPLAAETTVVMDGDKNVRAVFGYTVSGYVLLIADTPLADVEIEFDSGLASVQTDASGYWEKDNLQGVVEVSPIHDEYSFGPSIQVVQGPARHVNFVAIEDLEVIMYPTVRVFTESEAKNIVAIDPDGTIVFEETTPFVQSLQVGNTLIAGIDGALPEGLMVKITEISTDGKQISTRDATLDNVIQEGIIEVFQSIPFEELVEHLEFAPGIEVIEIDAVRYSMEIEVSFPHGVTARGLLALGSSLDIDMEMGWLLGFDHFRCVIETDIDLDLSVSAQFSGSLNQEVIIGTFTAPGILWISTVPPVFLTLQFDFLVGLEGSVAVELETGAQWSRSYDVGFSYTRDALPEWETINIQQGSGWVLQEPDLRGEAALMSYAGVRLSGLSYGVAGLWVGAYAFCEAEAMMGLNPWRWQYDLGVGLEGALGARLNLLGITDLNWEPGRLRLLHYPAAYGVSGRITDDQGNGIEGVSIGFCSGRKPVETDSNGYWQAHLLSGTVIVQPRKTGYSFSPVERVISSSASDVDFAMQPLIYDIAGLVIDSDNQGVEGVEISFSQGYSSVYTAGDGSWSKSGLQDEITVRPAKSNYSFSPGSLRVDNFRNDVNFTAFSLSCPVAGVRTSHWVEGVEFWMRLAPDASFPRGACDTLTGKIDTPYWIAETQVTHELWHVLRTWALDNGYTHLEWYTSYPRWPQSVFWGHAVAWCNALSEYLGFDPAYRCWFTGEIIRRGNLGINDIVRWDQNASGFRLPTGEFGEWELAARYIGPLLPATEPLHSEAIFMDNLYWTPGNYASGATGPAYNPTDHGATGEVAWYSENSGNEMQDVAQKKHNALGLFDMSGNLPDWFFEGPTGLTGNRFHAGGFYFSPALDLMIGYQQDSPPYDRMGIRLLRSF